MAICFQSIYKNYITYLISLIVQVFWTHFLFFLGYFCLYTCTIVNNVKNGLIFRFSTSRLVLCGKFGPGLEGSIAQLNPSTVLGLGLGSSSAQPVREKR